MAKRALALRIDDFEMEGLKEIAKASGKSVTRVMLDGAKAHAQNLDLQKQIDDLKRQQVEMQSKFESVTGRKLQTKKEVRIPLTDQEHHALKVMAADRGTSMGLLLRQELEQVYLPDIRGEKPALEVVERD